MLHNTHVNTFLLPCGPEGLTEQITPSHGASWDIFHLCTEHPPLPWCPVRCLKAVFETDSAHLEDAWPRVRPTSRISARLAGGHGASFS